MSKSQKVIVGQALACYAEVHICLWRDLGGQELEPVLRLYKGIQWALRGWTFFELFNPGRLLRRQVLGYDQSHFV